MSAYLPPGVLECTIPGNRPEDVYAEECEEALADAINMAQREGWLPTDVTIYDLRDDLEAAMDERWGDSPLAVAEAAVERYVERLAAEEGGDNEA